MNIKLTQEQRDKLKALLLLDDGFSCVEVGHILLLDDDTVRKYRTQYLNHGANSLLEDHNKGTSSYLNEVELERLDKQEEFVKEYQQIKKERQSNLKPIMADKEQILMELTMLQQSKCFTWKMSKSTHKR